MKEPRNKKLYDVLRRARNLSPHDLQNVKTSNYHLVKDFVDIPVIGIYSNIDDIKWNTLPDKFVIKSDIGCSCNNVKCLIKKTTSVITNNKSNKANEANKANKSNKSNNKSTVVIYRDKLHRVDLNLSQIKNFFRGQNPIIIEKFLSDKTQGKIPFDFKFYMAYDEMLFLRVIDRNGKDNKSKVAIFDQFLKRIPHNEWFKPSGNNYLIAKESFELPTQIKEVIETSINIWSEVQILLRATIFSFRNDL